jgi:TolB-like protein
MIMKRKIIGIILASMLLYLPGCGGSGSMTKSFMREDVSLAHIQSIAVFPFEGGGRAPRIREFTITQVLASGLFDVVDKGRVDNILQQEVLPQAAPLNSEIIRNLGNRLNVQGIIFGSVEQIVESRGNATFPEITITMRLIDIETGLILWQASGRGSGYSLTDRLFGTAPKDSFQVTMELLNDLFATMQ